MRRILAVLQGEEGQLLRGGTVDIFFRQRVPMKLHGAWGRGLVREGIFTVTSLLNDISLSRASPLPQILYFYATTASAGETILVFIPRDRPELR